MKITQCISCGNCFDFIENKECPVDAMKVTGKNYKCPEIDQSLCIDCGKCKREIDCLGECIK